MSSCQWWNPNVNTDNFVPFIILCNICGRYICDAQLPKLPNRTLFTSLSCYHFLNLVMCVRVTNKIYLHVLFLSGSCLILWIHSRNNSRITTKNLKCSASIYKLYDYHIFMPWSLVACLLLHYLNKYAINLPVYVLKYTFICNIFLLSLSVYTKEWHFFPLYSGDTKCLVCVYLIQHKFYANILSNFSYAFASIFFCIYVCLLIFFLTNFLYVYIYGNVWIRIIIVFLL